MADNKPYFSKKTSQGCDKTGEICIFGGCGMRFERPLTRNIIIISCTITGYEKV